MFDVNTPDSMFALKKWWHEFRDRAPVADEDMNDYCCVVVGNKIDTSVNGKGRGMVSKSDALAFLDELVPPSSPSLTEQDADHSYLNFLTSLTSHDSSSPSNSPMATPVKNRPDSVDIHHPMYISHSPSSSRKFTQSRSPHFYSGTMTTTNTTLTIYHTPSSSFYHSARSSPEPTSPTSSFRQRKLNTRSCGSTSSGSADTITPSIYARDRGFHTSGNLLPSSSPSLSPSLHSPTSTSLPPLPLPLERGPKLFFTSAKTGEGVADVFEYIAYRLSRKLEYEEQLESRRMHYQESSAAETINLGLDNGGAGRNAVVRDGSGRWAHGCCSS